MNNLADSLGTALLCQPVVALDDIRRKKFDGAGIYTIYYVGPFPAYRLVTEQNLAERWGCPIYVGRATPEGTRNGVSGAEVSGSLRAQLTNLRRSINRAQNLDIADFRTRWLIIEPLWVALGESLLINRFSPVWNSIVDGFGSHARGLGRHEGERTRWDTIHPGPTGVDRFKVRSETPEAIEDDIEEFLRARVET